MSQSSFEFKFEFNSASSLLDGAALEFKYYIYISAVNRLKNLIALITVMDCD